MDVFEAIEKRRSVKHYDPNYRMTEEEVRRLCDLAMKSPTAFNLQQWRFVVVDDPPLRRQIRASAWDQAQITDASLLIVVCADLKAWEKGPERYWRNVLPRIRESLVSAIGEYYQGSDQAQRDEAMRSCGIAAQTLMLAAQGMGYDSCPIGGFDFQAVARLINLPADHVIGLMVVVGRGIKEAGQRPGQLDYSEIVIQNRFGD